MKLKSVEPEILYHWLEEGRVRLIDIREASEFVKERLPGASLHPYASLAPGEFCDDEKRIGVFYCRSGHRTALLAERLLASGFDEVYHLRGGLLAWKKAGLPLLVNERMVPDLTGQVLLIAGVLVLLGLLLSWFLSKRFLILVSLVGVSLILAALTDSCLLKGPLFLLPRNRRLRYVRKGSPHVS